MSNEISCYKCNSRFAELDVPIKCDGCSSMAHQKCSGLSTTELKCLGLKNRLLKFFCIGCDQGLKELPELKTLIKKLLVEVDGLKNNSNVVRSDDFIINEINERNVRSKNLIFYNVNECESNRSDERTANDVEQVTSTIKSIFDSSSVPPLPLKVIRLGRYQSGKLRPIKAVFASASDAFDIMKNKKKIALQNPPSPVSISTDRTQYQRESMKKLREELALRTKNGHSNLTIKFIKGTPKIVELADTRNNQSQHFLDSM